ncbi:KRAB-A domain-containing protein 2-like [Metopolophium dirhodum]|uniref:KRAB-A domain-containing protein 2-like n=1 Tax=Metopolophium dirhodum TaxID=44670 RepID=UPI00298F40AA|nr:KRAB-A domain-containing protein 2-like [Metopolophium dirhodum]
MLETEREMSTRERFFKKLMESVEGKKDNHYNIITKDAYDSLLKEVEDAISATKKTSAQYRRIKRFNVLEFGDTKKLVTRGEPVKYYLPMEDIFDVIDLSHIAVGHGGRDRLKVETSRKYANITTDMINIFLSLCETCQKKKKLGKKGLVSKPILHTELNSRCQIDLIDMQSQPDAQFKFILNYQDHLTKFVLLRPLQTKRAEEVASHLLDIFLTFGAPVLLHSDNGREFVNSVITELTGLWPELKIVHGKPRHSQSQGSVERANQDVERMLASWMTDNKSTNWSIGLKFVQFMKNRAHHAGINMTPYKAMFGVDPRVGLVTSNLPNDLIATINVEDELENLICTETGSENKIEQEAADTSFIGAIRKEAHENLEKQAARMMTRSEKKFPAVDVGVNVVIRIPDVDKGKTDHPNLIGVVLEKTEHDLYRIGSKDGILEKLYCRSEFITCEEKFITENQVPNNHISLRAAATKASTGSGQGFVRCTCKTSCGTNRCLCRKNKILCNSKCHNSLSCQNK